MKFSQKLHVEGNGQRSIVKQIKIKTVACWEKNLLRSCKQEMQICKLFGHGAFRSANCSDDGNTFPGIYCPAAKKGHV